MNINNPRRKCFFQNSFSMMVMCVVELQSMLLYLNILPTYDEILKYRHLSDESCLCQVAPPAPASQRVPWSTADCSQFGFKTQARRRHVKCHTERRGGCPVSSGQLVTEWLSLRSGDWAQVAAPGSRWPSTFPTVRSVLWTINSLHNEFTKSDTECAKSNSQEGRVKSSVVTWRTATLTIKLSFTICYKQNMHRS